MDYQIDTRNERSQEVRVGRNNLEVAAFRKTGFFIYNLKGEVEGIEYQLKLPAPWTGFRYRLLAGKHELANAKKKRRMFAFEPDRPLIRHISVEFELDLQGQPYQLISEDRHGLEYVVLGGDEECGRLALRTFEAQQAGSWQADFHAPSEWSIPHAAFVAWLAREGRSGMGI